MGVVVRASICLFAFIIVTACVRATDEKSGTTSPATTNEANPSAFVAEQTALLEIALRPDGTASIAGVSPRPIPFRGRHLVPFDPARYEPTSAASSTPVAPPTLPGGTADGTVAPGDVSPRTPVAALPVDRGGVLVVRHTSLTTPLVVPLTLGHPGEGGGDVADRWQNTTVILRGPFFGPGTRYTLLRLTERGATALAEREVAP